MAKSGALFSAGSQELTPADWVVWTEAVESGTLVAWQSPPLAEFVDHVTVWDRANFGGRFSCPPVQQLCGTELGPCVNQIELPVPDSTSNSGIVYVHFDFDSATLSADQLQIAELLDAEFTANGGTWLARPFDGPAGIMSVPPVKDLVARDVTGSRKSQLRWTRPMQGPAKVTGLRVTRKWTHMDGDRGYRPINTVLKEIGPNRTRTKLRPGPIPEGGCREWELHYIVDS